MRRARINARRYCTSLGLDRLVTLTFRCRRCDQPTGCVCPEGPDRPRHDEFDFVVACIESFRRRVRSKLGRVPLLIVVEHHKDGCLHVHFVFDRWLDQDVIAQCWGWGFVKLKRKRHKGFGERVGKREKARRCAAYVTKYITKEHHEPGRKSYSTTRGLVPAPVRQRFMTREEALGWLSIVTGEQPGYVWSSEDVEGWEAPPVWLLFYGDGGGG